jgi:hypothetical protein
VTERQPGIDPGGDLSDIPGPHQQPVTVDLGVGRIVPESPQKEL